MARRVRVTVISHAAAISIGVILGSTWVAQRVARDTVRALRDGKQTAKIWVATGKHTFD